MVGLPAPAAPAASAGCRWSATLRSAANEGLHPVLSRRLLRCTETKIPKALLGSLWHRFRVNKVALNLALNALIGFA